MLPLNILILSLASILVLYLDMNENKDATGTVSQMKINKPLFSRAYTTSKRKQKCITTRYNTITRRTKCNEGPMWTSDEGEGYWKTSNGP